MFKLFYVSYFASTAVLLPFFPPYLRSLGLSGREVALVMSTSAFLYLGVSLLWGWLADRTCRPVAVLRLVCVGAAVGLVPAIFVRGMPQLLYVYALHQFFAVGIMGLADSLAQRHSRTTGAEYSHLRLLGSLSFILTSSVTGQLLTRRAHQEADPLVPILMTGAFTLSALVALSLRAPSDKVARPDLGQVATLVRDPRFRFIAVVAPLHWAGNAVYNAFFSILVQDSGLPKSTASYAFAAGVAAELLAFFFFRRLRLAGSLLSLLAISFAAGTVRWLLVSTVESGLALVAIQLLHALTFGVFWASAMAWLGECVPPALRASGQALFTALTLGAGNLLGVLGAGLIYDASGSARGAFLAAGVVNIVPLALALAGRRPAAVEVSPHLRDGPIRTSA